MTKNPNPGYDAGKILRRMFSYIRKYKLSVFTYLAFSVGVTLTNLAFANLIDKSVGAAVDGKREALLRCVEIAVLAALAGVVATYLAKYFYGIFKAKVMLDIRNSAVSRLQKLKLSFIENSHTGDLISRYTNDMSTVQEFIGEDLFGTLVMFVSITLSAAYLVVINWKLFCISMVKMPVAIYLSAVWSKPMARNFKEASANVGKANAVAQDSYGGIFIVKAFNLEKFFQTRYSSLIQTSVDCSMKSVQRLRWMPIFNIINWTSPYLICMIYGSWLSVKGEISPGQLPAFVFLMGNIVWPVSGIPQVITNFRNSLGTAQRFFEVLDNPSEREDGTTFDCTDAQSCIAFRDVSFSYRTNTWDQRKNMDPTKQEQAACSVKPANPEPVDTCSKILNGLSFDLKPGKKLALVGESGCGKSTVLKLITAFYDCQEGKIEVFGHDLREWSIPAIRSMISLVSQETYLFPASIFDNILYGRPGASRDEVIQAAIAANAHEFILELPEGYETMVGERGIKLSGGQKQRISLARAFLKNAPVILLDEPTSALDTISEAQVQEGMNSIMRDRTAIIVTHRLSTIKDVDEIIVMDNGCIVERGTHLELSSRDSLYSKLYSKQAGKGEDAA